MMTRNETKRERAFRLAESFKRARERERAKIVADYWSDEVMVGYESSLSALEKTGLSASEADNLLHPYKAKA